MALTIEALCHQINEDRHAQLKEMATRLAEEFGPGHEITIENHCGDGRDCDEDRTRPSIRIRVTITSGDTFTSAAPKLEKLYALLDIDDKPGTILIISALDTEVCPDCGEGVKPGELAAHLRCCKRSHHADVIVA